MNYTSSVMLINEKIRAIKVSYDVDKNGNPIQCYIFKTLDQSIKVGDLVNIKTDTRHNMTVGRVEEVDADVDFESDIQLKWIVSKVETSEYENIIEEESKWIEKIKQSEKVRKKKELAKNLVEMHDDVPFDQMAIANMNGYTVKPVALTNESSSSETEMSLDEIAEKDE